MYFKGDSPDRMDRMKALSRVDNLEQVIRDALQFYEAILIGETVGTTFYQKRIGEENFEQLPGYTSPPMN
jgi:hypothetical protein